MTAPIPMILLAGALFIGGCGGGGDDASETAPAPPQVAVKTGEPIHVDGTPTGLAVGGGAVWAVDAAAGTLTRIDAADRSVTARVRVPGGPLAVAVGEGAAWVASGDGSVRAFDLRTGRAIGRRARVPGATGIAAGHGGVWVTSRIAGTVTRVDPGSREPGRAVAVGEGPADLAVGEGALWVLNAGAGTVSRIDTESAVVTATIDSGAPRALALAVGEGAVWVARVQGEFGERVEVVRVDPGEERVSGDAVPVDGAVPLDLVAAAGSVWATDAGDRRRAGRPRRGGVSRIDPARHALVGAQIRIGRGATAIAAGEGAVWVASAADGTVTPLVTRTDAPGTSSSGSRAPAEHDERDEPQDSG